MINELFARTSMDLSRDLALANFNLNRDRSLIQDEIKTFHVSKSKRQEPEMARLLGFFYDCIILSSYFLMKIFVVMH